MTSTDPSTTQPQPTSPTKALEEAWWEMARRCNHVANQRDLIKLAQEHLNEAIMEQALGDVERWQFKVEDRKAALARYEQALEQARAVYAKMLLEVPDTLLARHLFYHAR